MSDRPFRVIYPSTSTATQRYDRGDRVVPRHRLVPAALFSIGGSPNPPYLPKLWSQHIHPEGNLYFARHSLPKVITEANMYDQSIQDKVVAWVNEIEEHLVNQGIYLPDTVELTVDPDADLNSCKYYLVDHARRVQFWLEEVSTDEMGIRTSVSENHLGFALEELYWRHVEYFPSHEAIGFDPLLDDLLDHLLYASADQTSSAVSTMPFTPETPAQYTKLLTTARDAGRSQSPRMRWVICRLWAQLSGHKYGTHYGQTTCRLSRDQAILDLGARTERRVFSWTSQGTFGAARRYKHRLERLWVDEIVYLTDWRQFIASCHKEWILSVSLAFALLLCNLVSFIAPFSIQPLTILSILLCNGSILSGIALLVRHQDDATATSIDEALSYLDSQNDSLSGFENTALRFSLPQTFLLWAFGLFWIQGFAWFAHWTSMQRYGLIAGSALVLPCVGWLAFAAVRDLWQRRSRSRPQDAPCDVEAQIEDKAQVDE